MSDTWRQTNRAAWDAKVPVHVGSEFYDVAGFLAGSCSLNPAELNALGDVNGKTLLHLQCHFGLDTLSWARRGATVTGVDFSSAAIHAAEKLSQQAELPSRFVCSDVYDVSKILPETFDIVFTSWGVLGWLPDLERWADVVVSAMAPGGTFFLGEFHPVMWMLDDAGREITYPYAVRREPVVEETEGTYANPDAPLRTRTESWNHGLAEVIGVLLRRGLLLREFEEYEYSYYDCFPGLVRGPDGVYRKTEKTGFLPMMYHLVATKPS